jgi:hypothetical protein
MNVFVLDDAELKSMNDKNALDESDSGLVHLHICIHCGQCMPATLSRPCPAADEASVEWWSHAGSCDSMPSALALPTASLSPDNVVMQDLELLVERHLSTIRERSSPPNLAQR